MIFLDTSAFLAIENRKDAHHQKALSFRDELLTKGMALITTDYVLDECYTLLRLRASHRVAVEFGEAVQGSSLIRTEYMTPEILEKAWHIFKYFKDKEFSFMDCTSFAFMESQGIKAAFGFAEHFRQYGKITLLP